VPEVLLSGNHAAIARWRRRQSLKTTLERRPDLLQRVPLSEPDVAMLRELYKQRD
jgi:tRNA (guanine37-N1)-methyltransferase